MMALKPGQRLRRREPTGDAWDDVLILGFKDVGDDLEVVLSPAVGFAAPVAATAASVLGVYTIDVEPPIPLAEWTTPVEEIEA